MTRTPLAASKMAEARKAAGISQGAIAEKLGLTRAAVGAWEQRNIDVPAEHVEAVREILRWPLAFVDDSTRGNIRYDEWRDRATLPSYSDPEIGGVEGVNNAAEIAERLTDAQAQAALKQASWAALSTALSRRYATLVREAPDSRSADPRSVAVLEAAGLRWTTQKHGVETFSERSVTFDPDVEPDESLTAEQIAAAVDVLASNDALIDALRWRISRAQERFEAMGGFLELDVHQQATAVLGALGTPDPEKEALRALYEIERNR